MLKLVVQYSHFVVCIVYFEMVRFDYHVLTQQISEFNLYSQWNYNEIDHGSDCSPVQTNFQCYPETKIENMSLPLFLLMYFYFYTCSSVQQSEFGIYIYIYYIYIYIYICTCMHCTHYHKTLCMMWCGFTCSLLMNSRV